VAESASTELAVSPDMGDEDTSVQPKNNVLETLSSAETVRQVTMVVTLVLCIAIAIFIFLWSKEPTYRPLAQLPPQEMIETLDYLDQNQIQYKIEGSTIFVVESEFKDVRMGMMRQGISAENVFARKEKQASATVVVTAARGISLSGEEVDSIVDIVGSAVQGMVPSRVTVTDSNGRLLNSGSQDSMSARARKEYEIEKKREREYLQKIDSILIPVLGLGNYTAQADVAMDFTAVEQTQRRYNPDLPAVRSEMISEQNTVGAVIAGIPGALTNQPPLDSDIPENAGEDGNGSPPVPTNNSKEQTRNFELDTTISHTKKQTGVIRRLSVSVAVDHMSTINDAGETVSNPMSQQELLNIRRLLQGGIGFDVTRGDSLEVVSIPFNRMDTGPVEDVPIWEQPFFMPMLKLVMGAIVIVVLILAIVRPMLKRLIYPDGDLSEVANEEDIELDLGSEGVDLLSDDFDESQIGFARWDRESGNTLIEFVGR